jgi:poly-gamma-glutamate capsule biosynthesis protein CapA/YwtB (metallophosphatase superfamily)
MIRVLLCGDVMIGRGIDQILPDPCPPGLHEDYASSAADYVNLAAQDSGLIPAPADLAYVWGAALDMLREKRPDAVVVNLETSITRSEAYETKGINYRVSPRNSRCLQSFAVGCCALANNHVLDWGRAGLLETIDTLGEMGIKATGAGRDLREARSGAIMDVAGKGRVIVFSFAFPSSGVPFHWAATGDVPGVNLLPDLSAKSLALVCAAMKGVRQSGDILILSLHWGPNWGYEVSEEQRRFAHAVIDSADVSVIHGHSSHHAKAMEVYKNRLIMHGCGDFLNDYEGIEGYEAYRGDLSLMYFADVDEESGNLVGLEMAPLQIRQFRLERAKPADVDWLVGILDRESAPFGVRVTKSAIGALVASWRKVANLRFSE